MQREYHHFPKWKYHAGEEARIVADAAEEAALGDNWFDKSDLTNHEIDQSEAFLAETPAGYVPEQFPKWKYHATEAARVVNDADEETTLGEGWFDKSDLSDGTAAEPVEDDEPKKLTAKEKKALADAEAEAKAEAERKAAEDLL